MGAHSAARHRAHEGTPSTRTGHGHQRGKTLLATGYDVIIFHPARRPPAATLV